MTPQERKFWSYVGVAGICAFVGVLIAILVLFGTVIQAKAQEGMGVATAALPCYKTEGFRREWEEHLGEELSMVAPTAEHASTAYMYVHPDTGEWTFMVGDDSIVCVMAAGKAWQPVKSPLAKKKEGS